MYSITMSSNLPFLSYDGSRDTEHAEDLLDTNDDLASWQAGMDEIDTFFASCKSSPMQFAREAVRDNVESKITDRGNSRCGHNDAVDGMESSSSITEQMLCTANEGHHKERPKTKTETLDPDIRHSQQQGLLQSTEPTVSLLLTESADVASRPSALHVQPNSPTNHTIHAGVADSGSQPVHRNVIESAGSPMDLDTPPSPFPRLSKSMATPQPTASNNDTDPPSSSAGKTSLFDEMRDEDSEAVIARCTPHSSRAMKPLFPCEVARQPDSSLDLLNDHFSPTLPVSVVQEDTPTAKAKEQCRITLAGGSSTTGRDGLAMKRKRSSSDDHEATIAATSTVHDTYVAMEGVEQETDAATSHIQGGGEEAGPSTLTDLEYTSSPANDVQNANSSTPNINNDHPIAAATITSIPLSKKPRTTPRTSTLAKELKALQTSPSDTMRKRALNGTRAVQTTAVSVTKKSSKVPQASPRRTRAQKLVAPSGAAAAKSRHRKKG